MFLPGETHGQRGVTGYSPRGHKESDVTGQLTLPLGPVVKNLPCNAGDRGSIPGPGAKIPDASGQLSSHDTTKTQHSENKSSKILKEEIFKPAESCKSCLHIIRNEMGTTPTNVFWSCLERGISFY